MSLLSYFSSAHSAQGAVANTKRKLHNTEISLHQCVSQVFHQMSKSNIAPNDFTINTPLLKILKNQIFVLYKKFPRTDGGMRSALVLIGTGLIAPFVVGFHLITATYLLRAQRKRFLLNTAVQLSIILSRKISKTSMTLMNDQVPDDIKKQVLGTNDTLDPDLDYMCFSPVWGVDHATEIEKNAYAAKNKPNNREIQISTRLDIQKRLKEIHALATKTEETAQRIKQKYS